MVPIDRPGVDRHLQTPRDLAEQLPRSLPYIPNEHRYLYFAIHTRWYLQSQTACDPLL